jgi:predicted RNase H-like HicB family nuclease
MGAIVALQVKPMNMISPIARQEITVTLMIEPQESGRFVASVMEFPDCRVEGETREEAIELIHQQWQAQIDRVEFMPLSLPLTPKATAESPWTKLYGLYKDDPDFAEIAAAIRAERESDDESEVDPSVYQR